MSLGGKGTEENNTHCLFGAGLEMDLWGPEEGSPPAGYLKVGTGRSQWDLEICTLLSCYLRNNLLCVGERKNIQNTIIAIFFFFRENTLQRQPEQSRKEDQRREAA